MDSVLARGLSAAARARALAGRVAAVAPAHPDWARLVAVSGIDASGKGTLTRALAGELEMRGHRVAVIGLDDWHAPPEVRFGDPPGLHFYRHAFDLDRVFAEVIEPLRVHRALRLDVARPHPHTGAPRTIAYDFFDVDTILFEGVFLFRREFRARYDLRVWIDCPFDVALERALARNQEGVARARLRRDYAGIYFPAQCVHLGVDRPRDAAHVLVGAQD